MIWLAFILKCVVLLAFGFIGFKLMTMGHPVFGGIVIIVSLVSLDCTGSSKDKVT